MVVEVVDILGAAYGRVLKKAKEGYFWMRIGNSSSVHPETCGEVGSTHLTGSGSGLDAGSTSIGLPLSIHLNYSVFDCQWLFGGIYKEENP